MLADLAILVAMSTLAAPEWDVAEASPVLLHAEALDRELDQDLAAALTLLRQARVLAPHDKTIAFDLARLALEGDSDRFDDDVAEFMATTPENDDARVLRAYILVHQGQRQAAREQLNAVVGTSTELGEATRLRDLVIQDAVTAPAGVVSANLRLALEGDSNVTVVPDAPQREQGLRLNTQGTFTVVPLRAPTEVTLSTVLMFAPHLNHRSVLEEFDVGSALALARARQHLGPTVLTAQLSGSEVGIDGLQRRFMRDLFGDLELRLPIQRLQLALFGRGGYRDFTAFNPEVDPDDRDGARYSAGGLADWGIGQLTLGGQASFEAATTQGARQRETGTEVGVYLRWGPLPWQARLGVNYALRYFAQSRVDGKSRMDNRITTSLGLSRMLQEHLGAFVTLTWIKNLSNQAYAYDRVLAQAGMVTQW